MDFVDKIYATKTISSLEDFKKEINSLKEGEGFDPNSALLVNISKSVHFRFRKLAFKNRVTMSAILREFINKFIEGDPHLCEMVAQLSVQQRTEDPCNKSVDHDKIYELIAQEPDLEKEGV